MKKNLYWALVCLVFQNACNKAEQQASPVPPSVEVKTGILATAWAKDPIYDLLIDATRSVAGSDPRANRLVVLLQSAHRALYINNMIFTMDIPDASGKMVTVPKNALKIAIDSGDSVRASALYMYDYSTIMVNLTQKWSKTWLGLVLLHELAHAEDMANGRVPLGGSQDHSAYREFVAFHFEGDLLNQYTKGKFYKMIAQVAHLDDFPTPPLDVLTGVPLSDIEGRTRDMVYTIIARFVRLDRMYGEEKALPYKLEFMKRMLPKHELLK